MSKWYGNLNNRLEEGQNFTGREIRVGDDITEYLWSDRRCYYVSEVESQKRIKVKPYYVCADKSKAYGMGHQDWLYFKDMREFDKYCNISRKEEEYDTIDHTETWVFRYNKWMKEFKVTDVHFCETDREWKQFNEKGYFITYGSLTGKVSFGVRDYYHDWEF